MTGIAFNKNTRTLVAARAELVLKAAEMEECIHADQVDGKLLARTFLVAY